MAYLKSPLVYPADSSSLIYDILLVIAFTLLYRSFTKKFVISTLLSFSLSVIFYNLFYLSLPSGDELFITLSVGLVLVAIVFFIYPYVDLKKLKDFMTKHRWFLLAIIALIFILYYLNSLTAAINSIPANDSGINEPGSYHRIEF